MAYSLGGGATGMCKAEEGEGKDQFVRVVNAAPLPMMVLAYDCTLNDLSTTGGMGRAATTFYKRLAAMLSEKRDVPYSKMMGWIRCRMSFSLLRASVMSIRGTRSSATRGALHEPIELQATEGQLQVV